MAAIRPALPGLVLLLLAGCSGMAPRDGGPDRHVDLASVPDAVPRDEPHSRYGNPAHYEVYGKRYHVRDSADGYVERGIASWYGTKFHGRRTSSGEPYDMYRMTAAHKTLPLPTYCRVTNLRNGRSVIVRVNDRGPFHANRIIDLSYVAAAKLGIAANGTGLVEVRALDPGAPEEEPVVREARAEPANPEPEQRAARTRPDETRASAVREAVARGGEQAEAALRKAAAKAPAKPAPPQPAAPEPATPEPAVPETAKRAGGESLELYLQVGAFMNRGNAERLRDRLRDNAVRTVRIEPFFRTSSTVYRVRVGPLPDVEEADLLSERITALGIGPPQVVID